MGGVIFPSFIQDFTVYLPTAVLCVCVDLSTRHVYMCVQLFNVQGLRDNVLHNKATHPTRTR